jgi:hypothetical protein
MEQTTSVRLVWPPPGLEGTQGVLWRRAGELGLGGSVLVFPLLFSVARPQPFSSLGAFGSAWWVPLLTSALGSLLVIRALAGLLLFFRTARRASHHGIDLETVLQVAADHNGEVGALLQGTRCFRTLEGPVRERAVRTRIWACLLFLSASTWIILGWALSLLLASRGLLKPGGMWILTLGPAGMAVVAGVAMKGIEGTLLQAAFRPLFWNRWRNPGQQEAASQWGEGLRRYREERGERLSTGTAIPTAGALSVVGLSLLVLLPTAGLTMTGAAGSLLASLSIPKFSTVQQRAGAAEALRPLRLATDPSITPMEAGQALHALVSAGNSGGSEALLLDPVRAYDEPFLPLERENPVGVPPEEWAVELFPMAQKGFSPEAEAYLMEAAGHPGLAEFDVLALAEAIDVLGGRLVLPFPEGTSSFDIPIPRLMSVRLAGYSMVGRAALQFQEGDAAGADHTLRTLLSAGLLMGEQSPFLIDALVGYVLALVAGDGLQTLYGVAGRETEAETLDWVRQSAKGAAERAVQGRSGFDAASALRGMPATVGNQEALRGLRWEYLHLLAGISDCVNPNQIVFGPGVERRAFMEEVRAGLVRFPSEEALFDVMAKGWTELPGGGGPGSALAGTVRAVLGDRAGSCASLFATGVF